MCRRRGWEFPALSLTRGNLAGRAAVPHFRPAGVVPGTSWGKKGTSPQCRTRQELEDTPQTRNRLRGDNSLAVMRNTDQIDSELRLLTAVRDACRDIVGVVPSTQVIDVLLDERLELGRRSLPER
jgi:hypothetical protein